MITFFPLRIFFCSYGLKFQIGTNNIPNKH